MPNSNQNIKKNIKKNKTKHPTTRAEVILPGDAISSGAKIFDILRKQVPLDRFGLPKYIYRADLLPDDLDSVSSSERKAYLISATIDLSMREGFPTLPDGTFLWSNLEFEPTGSYNLFKDYLELGKHKGVRSIHDLAAHSTEAECLNRAVILETYIRYYWDVRARAHDLFNAAAAERVREQRILSTTDTHYLKAESLMSQLSQYFEQTEIDEEGNEQLIWLQEMTPKVAIESLEKLVRIQRLSLGLSSTATPKEESIRDVSSVDDLLTQMTTGSINEAAASSNDVVALLKNSKIANIAQLLITEVNKDQNKAPVEVEVEETVETKAKTVEIVEAEEIDD